MKDKLKKYWKLIINVGVNVQPGQKLVINAPIECSELVHMATEQAYDAGAKQVIVRWIDDDLSRIQYLRADDSIFDTCDPWSKAMLNPLAKEGAAFLTIYASDPECLKGVDPDRIIRSRRANNKCLRPYRSRIMTNKNRWCVVSSPTKKWAMKIFPNEKTTNSALDKLWDAIFRAARIDENDPVDNWLSHSGILKSRYERLNKYNFKHLKLTSSNGTNLIVGLAKGHTWEGGLEKAADGITFSPNIPSEEIFTCPDRNVAEGVVKSSKPLVYQGNIIDNFTITFKNGRAISAEAEKGEELLQKLIKTDKNAAHLGEIALVPYHSPISESGLLFYNTLFDENAACHLAFGEAYPKCVKGTEGKSPKALISMGVNQSQIHEDFMIGTSDMNIIGVMYDGSEVEVFKNGDFAF